MKRPSTQTILFAAIALIVLSIAIGGISLIPVHPPGNQSYVLVNDTFTLSPNETYRQGLGSFHGGENITIQTHSPTAFQENFSIMYPVLSYYSITNDTAYYSNSTQSNINYTFTAATNYYDAVFTSASPNTGTIHLTVTVQELKAIYQYSWLTEPSRIMFYLSLGAAIILTLKILLSRTASAKQNVPTLPSLGKKGRQTLLALLVLSLVIWFLILAINPNPLATFESWYTDSARHTYTSSLFLKDGFSVFYQPLGQLANLDNSNFKFVTWPQMPHLYPLGSILLFLPFGVLVQNGFNPTFLFQIEIALFLVIATICVYFFLKIFFTKDMALLLKLLGVYIIYVSLVVYAADGMFDSIAFLFSLFAISMFLAEHYDYFFLLVMISVFFKYQAGIFLLPLIIVGLIRLLQNNTLGSLRSNKSVIAGIIFGLTSIFTAYLSAPYLITVSPQLVMNGINAFSANSQIYWTTQIPSILLTLVITLAYAAYMLNKNTLLSLSALFLLLPIFTLPYFQNWYLPFIFIYALIPQKKQELEITTLWLIFIITVLTLAGTNYQLIFQIPSYLHNTLPYVPHFLPHLSPLANY